MRYFYKTSIFLFLLFLILPFSNVKAEEKFNDLTYSQWAKDDIYYLTNRGTIAGLGNGKFGPTQTITRAQAVAFLVRELYPTETASVELQFKDLSKNHYFYNDIAVAFSKGLIGGYPDQTFRPEARISRSETTAILARAYSVKEGTDDISFSDVEGDWAYESIKLLSSNSLIGGYGDGTFQPKKSVTRAEFASILTRSVQFKRSEAISNKDWDELLRYMTLKEKVGQMMMPDIQSWQGQETYYMNDGTSQTIKENLLGGVILFNKNIQSIEQITTLTHQLQNETYDIPLFISIDQEGGDVKRIPNGTNLPGNMALGATRNPVLSFEAGKLTGAELHALGVNVNFAPVLDVNVNPNNPIIGIRSYGEDPQLVAEMGTQFMKGLQESGIISTAKHFPGHGDTHVDSHLGLPTLPHNLTRLEEVELVPFRESIHNGVDMIMTAHITFPSIDHTTVISKKDVQKINLPATLSKKVITGLLRTDLGFEGVIVSDAFTMKAISEHFGDENAAKMAVQAGVDIILTPQDVAKTAKAVVDAVRKGEISEETIDQSVKRILVLKDKYHLFNQSTSSLSNKVEKAKHIVGSKDHLLIEQKIAEQAITLVKDEQNQLPHSIHNNERIVVLSQKL